MYYDLKKKSMSVNPLGKKKNSACFPINSVSKTFGLAPHQYDWIINPLAIINTLL